MSRLVARRGRLLRVRHVQHVLAVADAVQARDTAAQIESNALRLANVRSELFGTPGPTTGAVLASHRELAGRLEQAGRQLDGALYDAQRRIDQSDARRIAADREREIAERLKDKARRAADMRAEARIAALPLYRRLQSKGENEA
jgi:hypothetical protein